MRTPSPIEAVREQVNGMIRENEPLSGHATLRVGGPADLYIEPADLDSLQKAVAVLRDLKMPLVILGNGSNVIVRDGGIRGAVIVLKECCGGIEELSRDQDSLRLQAGAGVSLNRLIRHSLEAGYAGLEILSGIPAQVGGAVAMNAGTKEGEIAACVEEVLVLNERGNLQRIPAAKLKWEYRHLDLPNKAIVLSAVFQLKKDDPQAIQRRRDAVLKYRQDTQPVDWPSLGSVFKNPPKLKAGALIDEAGLKGVRLRQAMISEKHANWIVNLGGATAQDVLALIRMVQEKVREKSGVKLELEARVLGVE